MKLLKHLVLFLTGGLIYILIELLFRGRTHWSMFLVGGMCFVLVGGLNNWFTWELSIVKQMLYSSFIITGIEFLAGLVLNVWLGWDVWDYSNMPFNVYGQICLPFMIVWFFLAFLAIVVDDFLRWRWFGENFPEYHIFAKEA